MYSLSRTLVGSLLATTTLVVSAQEQTFNLNIPAQALSAALESLGQKTGLHVFYAENIIKGKNSQALNGNYTPQQAIEKLLAGSGLAYTFTAKDIVAIKPADSSSNTLPAVRVTEQAVYDSTDPYNKNYAVPNATTATKTDTPIMETPFSVQVIPRAVMDDQQVISLKESVQNVSGVQWSPVVGNLYENFVIRGFDANNSTARNGIREDSFAVETANVERVEILKGPAAMLYGRLEPGGLVNRVTKQPLFTSYYSAQQQFGSFNNYRTTIDVTGPINNELAYRFNIAYQDTKSYRDYVGDGRVFLSPSLTWRPTDRTELGLTFEYQHDYGRWDDGIPAIGNRPADVPINRYMGDPRSFYEIERKLVDLHWSYDFNKDWKINQRFVTSLANYHEFSIFPWGLHADNQTLDLYSWNNFAERNTYSQNINIVGHFDSWGAQHTFLSGFDFYIYDQPGKTLLAPSNFGSPTQNIYNPVYGQFNNLDFMGQPTGPTSAGFNGQTWYGVYMQDQIKLWDKLQFHLGGRYDWATIGTAWSAAPTTAQAQVIAERNAISAEKFNPRFGILYQPWRWMSLYANYSESLGGNNGRDINNMPLKPQEARQYEIGMKNELFEGRLISTLAFFDIYKQNVSVPSPNAILAQQGYMLAVGEARSHGIEYDLSGKVTENFSLIANYALTDARVSKDFNQPIYDSLGNQTGTLANGYSGNRLPLAPLHSSNIWAKYEFADATFKGLNIGAGTHIASQTQGDPANDFQLPAYVTLNAMASYQYKLTGSTITTQFNVNNLLDHRFYSADQADAAQRFNIIPAAPLNFMGSVRIEF